MWGFQLIVLSICTPRYLYEWTWVTSLGSPTALWSNIISSVHIEHQVVNTPLAGFLNEWSWKLNFLFLTRHRDSKHEYYWSVLSDWRVRTLPVVDLWPQLQGVENLLRSHKTVSLALLISEEQKVQNMLDSSLSEVTSEPGMFPSVPNPTAVMASLRKLFILLYRDVHAVADGFCQYRLVPTVQPSQKENGSNKCARWKTSAVKHFVLSSSSFTHCDICFWALGNKIISCSWFLCCQNSADCFHCFIFVVFWF